MHIFRIIRHVVCLYVLCVHIMCTLSIIGHVNVYTYHTYMLTYACFSYSIVHVVQIIRVTRIMRIIVHAYSAYHTYYRRYCMYYTYNMCILFAYFSYDQTCCMFIIIIRTYYAHFEYYRTCCVYCTSYTHLSYVLCALSYRLCLHASYYVAAAGCIAPCCCRADCSLQPAWSNMSRCSCRLLLQAAAGCRLLPFGF